MNSVFFEPVMVAPREAYVPGPPLVVIQRPDWFQLRYPPLKQGGLNSVLLAKLSPQQVDATISRVKAEYAAHQSAFVWLVGPDSTPENLGQYLLAHGGKPTTFWGMARQTESQPVSADVRRVGPEDIDHYSALMGQVWQMDPGPLAALNRRFVEDPNQKTWFFWAWVDGKPRAIAQMVWLAETVHFLGAAVLPEYRKRGLYQALVARRLSDAAAGGRALATIQALAETSGPILLRHGFQKHFEFVSYFWPGGE